MTLPTANPHARRQLPKLAELAPLLRLQRPTLSPRTRRLRNATDIAELRQAARRVTPRAVFDYVDGAADAEITIDSGILRGADALAAVALGASGVLVGRAYLYGLMAGGEAGVDRVGQIFDAEIRTAMALLGCRTIAEVTAELVALGR